MLIWSVAVQDVTKVASASAPKLSIVVPLIAACILIAVSISFFAHRGKLHIPGYAGIAALGFVLSLIFGKFAGARSIAGTTRRCVLLDSLLSAPGCSCWLDRRAFLLPAFLWGLGLLK